MIWIVGRLCTYYLPFSIEFLLRSLCSFFFVLVYMWGELFRDIFSFSDTNGQIRVVIFGLHRADRKSTRDPASCNDWMTDWSCLPGREHEYIVFNTHVRSVCIYVYWIEDCRHCWLTNPYSLLTSIVKIRKVKYLIFQSSLLLQ